jgi:very-short-patch-repair endonuclease
MKIAHSEGRPWNIGQSRWNNEPSYPEKFFMSVIENEFEDKNYTREYPFNKYSLDFAWVEKRRAIEIDGEQHQRFAEYAERDTIKDSLLLENGWEVLRIEWKDMYNNTKEKIDEAKKFIMRK